MKTNPFPIASALENRGLRFASEAEFYEVARELKLSDLAKQVAQGAVDCRDAVELIAAVAPVRALGQAALRYESSMGPLADYLIEATKRWALQFRCMYEPEYLPIPTITFAEALQQEAELMMNHTRESTLIAKPTLAEPSTAFRQVLTETETIYKERPNEFVFKMKFGPVGCECFVRLCERLASLFFYLPIFIPSNRQGEVAEALVWANWQASFGAFEMDHTDGQVRFHYALPLIGPFTDEHAGMMLSVATNAMRRYAGAICTLALTDYDPHGIMKAAKQRDETDQRLMREISQQEAA